MSDEQGMDNSGSGQGREYCCLANPFAGPAPFYAYTADSETMGRCLQLELEDNINIPNASLSQDASSLHLATLVEEYWEPSSPDQAGQLKASSTSLLNIHHLFSSCDAGGSNFNISTEKCSLHELQTILQILEHVRHTGLRTEVMRAVKMANQMAAANSNSYYKHEQLQGLVLRHLQEMGFNAGICKSKRSESSSTSRDLNSKQRHFPAEEYTYMDVILAAAKETSSNNILPRANDQTSTRVLIDLRFRSAFEIARPSPAYVELLKAVPICYVGSSPALHKIIRLLSGAMKRSLESQGMPLPPWRTLSFLHSKWLSPAYSRTLTCAIINPLMRQHTPKPYSGSNLAQKPPPSNTSKKAHYSIARKSSNLNTKIYSSSPANVPFLPLASNRILTNCNAAFVPKHNTSQYRSTSGTSCCVSKPAQAEPWQLPRLITQRSLSPSRPRKLVGALTVALQHTSIDTNAMQVVQVSKFTA
ncbi:hypothetical protein GOP47_0002742 [Adiantum capillus-veneris]|uniref:Uncharacterized protein n=1 Tax=Adiantum capillus-veneris TaxID=13818 RepID=A0A9D4VBG3_ADICA|nr:hypothetical protein GOP47_0002742 [Adiantum capillus-veneris]